MEKTEDLKEHKVQPNTIAKERVFETEDISGNKINLKIIRPNQEQINEADLKYKIKYAQALREGVMTRAQAEIFIKKQNIVDETILKRRDELVIELGITRLKLRDEKDNMKCLDFIKQINNIKTELTNINLLTFDIMNQTAEMYAEDFRIQWLCYLITKTIDNSSWFKDYRDFANRINEKSTIDAVKTMLVFFNGLDDKIEMSFDENKWLMEKNILNQDGTFNNEQCAKFAEEQAMVNQKTEEKIEDIDVTNLPSTDSINNMGHKELKDSEEPKVPKESKELNDALYIEGQPN